MLIRTMPESQENNTRPSERSRLHDCGLASVKRSHRRRTMGIRARVMPTQSIAMKAAEKGVSLDSKQYNLKWRKAHVTGYQCHGIPW